MSANSRRTHSSSARSRSTQLSNVDFRVGVPCVTAAGALRTPDGRTEFVVIEDTPTAMARGDDQDEIAVRSPVRSSVRSLPPLVISILRGLAFSATGIVSRSTPAS